MDKKLTTVRDRHFEGGLELKEIYRKLLSIKRVLDQIYQYINPSMPTEINTTSHGIWCY